MSSLDEKVKSVFLTPRSVVLFLGVVFVAYLLWQIQNILLLLLVSIVVASFVENGVRAFHLIRIPRPIAVVLMYLIVILGLGVGLYYFIPLFLDEIVDIAKLLPQDSTLSTVFNFFGDNSVRQVVSNLSQEAGANPFNFVNEVRGQLSAFNILQTMGALFGGLVNFILIIVFSFYLSVLKDGVGDFLRVVTPVQHESYVLSVWQRSRRKISGWFRGQVFIAFIQSLLTYAGLLLIGVPYAVLLAVATFITSLVPYGFIFVAIPTLALGYLAGGIQTVFYLAVFYIAYQMFESYVLQPLVIRQVTGLPSFIIILSLIIGAQLAGIIGLLLAIPVAVIILELVNDGEKRRIESLQKLKNG